jgi:membrane-associated phospholipid phosphatase
MMPVWRQTVLALVGAGILVVPASSVSAQRPFPYRLTPWLDGSLAVVGAGLLAGGVAVGNGQVPLTPAEIGALDPAQVNGFDRSAARQWSPGAGTASDVLVYTLLASPVALVVSPPGSGAVLTVAAMYGEALLVGNGATSLLKSAIGRTRPFAYNDNPDIPASDKQSLTARRSFPSGHTMHAVTAAVFLSTVYGKLHPTSSLRPWIWAGSMTAAGTVGYLRYRAGDHFPTDVIAGAALGGLVGWAVPRLHERDDVQVAIFPAGGGTALVVSLRH